MNTPTWESDCGTVKLWLGDCLEVMPTWGDGEVDAVVTDPPYCSGGATEAAKGRSTHQGLRTETIRKGRFSWFDADNMTTGGLCYLLRSVFVGRWAANTSAICFCDWRMLPVLSPAIESAGWRYRSLIVWDKGHFGCGNGFRPQHELAMHFTKNNAIFHSASIGNVLRYPREGAGRKHPTQKPVELIEDMLQVTSLPSVVVADPFMGAGTTGVAAVRLGRRFYGIELDPDYFEIAKRRIKDELRAARFLDPKPREVQPELSFD